MIVRTLITDFSHVYVDMGLIDALRNEGYDMEVLDLSALEGTNCYCAPETEEIISNSVAPYTDFPIRWIDSGDYHYMTKILAETVREPFTLFLLDNHSDDQEPEFGSILSCGSWVSAVKKENPFLEDIVYLGPDNHQLYSGGRYGNLYISLDKDIMSREWARTDWSQGEYRLEDILSAIALAIDSAENILAIDICGEISSSHGATPEDMRINLETDLRIQKHLTEILTKR